jgi:phosphopantetheinyl transferase
MQNAERELSAGVGDVVRFRSAVAPMDVRRLEAGERPQYDAMAPARQGEWLLGRTALKQLLPAGTDTSAVTFPHPQLSISHACGMAVAVHVAGALGTGVDVELADRRPDRRTARFFLHADERAEHLSAGELLRLWTVKESLFKATPDNAQLELLDYRLADAASTVGVASGPRGERFRYATAQVADYVLTVAVCRSVRRTDVAV